MRWLMDWYEMAIGVWCLWKDRDRSPEQIETNGG